MKKTLLKSLLAATIGMSAMASTSASADVILHAFNWKYSEVTAKASDIANKGYKKVLVSPALKSTGSKWWARYQPQDYRVIDSPLGNTQDFQTMINTLRSKGVDVYADIVLNHMANESSQRSDLNYPGTTLLNDYASNASYYNSQKMFGNLSQNLFGAGDFHAAGCISNYNNVGEVQYWRLCGGNGDPGLPDLDPNSWVVSQQKAYLQALKDMGVKGFRVDAAKHMTNYHINAVFTNSIKSGMHVFGEVITSGGSGDSSYDGFLKPYLNATGHAAYDFPLFNQIRSAFSYSGSMSQLVDPGAYGQALTPSKAVTFTVTHDIPLNDGFRYLIMDSTDEKLGYAYIMGRDGGVPMVYSDHNESGDNRWNQAYKDAGLTSMIRFHNSVSGSGMQIIGHNNCFILFRRDHKGVVGINKCGTDQDYWLDTSANGLWWNRNYRDVLTGQSIYVNTTWENFKIPARSARMWLME